MWVRLPLSILLPFDEVRDVITVAVLSGISDNERKSLCTYRISALRWFMHPNTSVLPEIYSISNEVSLVMYIT